MGSDSRSGGEGKATLEALMRERIRATPRVSKPARLEAVRALAARNLGAPVLAVIDGNPGLSAAPAIQRCTNHKLWNLLANAPAHLREELAEDYRRMIYAPTREAVEQARLAFTRKWQLRCEAVSSGFAEAGDELLHLYPFPVVAVERAAHH